LLVRNKGPLSATGVRLHVQLPAALTGVAATPTAGTCSVAVGEVTCAVPVLGISAAVGVHVAFTPSSPMLLPVSADVTHVERDSVPADNTATANATAGELVDLGVTMTPSTTTAQTGAMVAYTLQVTNNGPVASSGGTLTFAAASGLSLPTTVPTGCTASGNQIQCALDGLAVSGLQSFTFPTTANTAGTHVANASVSVLAAAADTDTTNNSASSTLTVNAAPVAPPPDPSPSNPTPPASNGGGGGGGAIGYLSALFLLLMTVVRLETHSRLMIARRSFAYFL
jgi:uncharacterized repeat protein (TIGR01451 family)